MLNEMLLKKAEKHLDKFCIEIFERCVGSKGNIEATDYFNKEIALSGWQTITQEFAAIDWKSEGAILKCGGSVLQLKSSPYSLGCDVEGILVSATTVNELEMLKANGKILFLYGEIVKEQLSPKNFVFYNPEEHQKIVSLLEKSGVKAIIYATGRNSDLAGGEYPFAFIEDGDFDIPSAFTKDIDAKKIIPFIGKNVSLRSNAERIPGKGYNVLASKGNPDAKKITVTAHIDAKKGTAGAIDNATGVITLLLLAEIMKDYAGQYQIELVALNGEDYYGVPGQMEYIKNKNNDFSDIFLNINIDGLGYKDGNSSFSLFNLPDEIHKKATDVIKSFEGISEGVLWPQGDHSIFIQYGVPAIAVSSIWLTSNMANQDVTHTPKDNPSIVDCKKILEAAFAISKLVESL